MDSVNPMDHLVLGHMPLVGISYQSREKDEEYRRRFAEAGEMKRVLDAAVELGIRKFAASTPSSASLASLHLEALGRLIDEGHDIKLIPCIGVPIKVGETTVDAYRRWMTHLAVERRLSKEVERLILDDPILNFREGWKRRLPVSEPYGRKDYERLKIDWRQIEEDLERFAGLPVLYMEPGSETDFLTIASRFDLIGELVDRIKERGYGNVLLGVHHAGLTIPRLDEELKGFNGYMTPLNPMGVMMFPTKESAENAIRSTKKAVYAIKPLAGGRVEPGRAFTYVFGFDVDGCMVGAASVAEIKEDFQTAIEVLGKTNHKRSGH